MAANQEFQCKECGATFNNEESLERHNRMVHSHYTCEHCGMTFNSDEELGSHNHIAHPETQRTQR